MERFGSVVGNDEWALTQVRDLRPFFSTLMHPALSSQEALLLLRMLGLPKLNYLSRVHPPSAFMPAARLFNKYVEHILRSPQRFPASSYCITTNPSTFVSLSWVPASTNSFRHSRKQLHSFTPTSLLLHSQYLNALPSSFSSASHERACLHVLSSSSQHSRHSPAQQYCARMGTYRFSGRHSARRYFNDKWHKYNMLFLFMLFVLCMLCLCCWKGHQYDLMGAKTA